jgi:hypothetical protein
MKKMKWAVLVFGFLVTSTGQGFSQNALAFTSVNATPDNHIQLHWASNSNEVYEIDYADQLAGNPDGSTAWNPLYEDYPSHGTNSFITDDGNYDLTPEIPYPGINPERFYRVMLVEDNSSPTNPTVSIVSPSSGDSLSGDVTMQVFASSPEILADVKLYVDGEEQWSSIDSSNFDINTCEWANGTHTIFATAKSQSGFEGVANGGVITYGRTVSSYVTVTFSNLISSLNFSQPFFEPALGQTQAVTAAFAANCNWTLQIQDVNSNTVLSASGSGSSMEYDWDGTGTGETNIPDGVYNYVLTASTNGAASEVVSGGGGSGGGSPPTPDFAMAGGGDSTELWASTSDDSDVVPLILYPPGFDTNGLTIFSATPAQVNAARSESLSSHSVGTTSFPMDASPDYSGTTSQTTTGPKRKPRTGVKGEVGTYGICYKTYGTNGFSSPHPITGWPYPLPTEVAIDGQTRTATTVDYSVQNFVNMSDGFSAIMKKAAWKPAFVKRDSQWGDSDIKKSSLGGNSIFNTCNFGMLMTHGSYGNSGSTGQEDDNINYTYCWLGGNDYVRLTDMDFGSTGTNGLRWMTIFACNILREANYNSMNNAGKNPVNENLHLLLGFDTTGYAAYNLGKFYANYLVNSNYTVINSLADGCADSYQLNSTGITNIVRVGIVGWNSCQNDSLQLYNDPDLNGIEFNERTVFIP